MADFDPDKYLREKERPPAAGFDPDAYLAEKQQAAPASAGEPPSGLESFMRGAVQGGTIGFGDELGGAFQGGLQALANVGARLNASGHPGVADALEKLGIEAHYGTEPASNTYAQARDAMRRQDAEAAHAHPMAFGGGALAGGIATAKPLGIAAGAIPGLAAKGLLPALGRGAALGALAGLGTSEADTAKGMALDAAGVSGAQRAAHDLSAGNYGAGALDLLGSGALGGTMATLGGYGLGKAISPAMDKLAIKTGRRALTNGARQLSNKEPLSEGAVRDALESGAIQPMGTTEDAYQRLQHLLGHDRPYPLAPAPGTPMALYSGILDALDQEGVAGAKVRPLVDDLVNKAAEAELTTGANKAVPRLYMKEAQNLENVSNGAERLPFMQAEKIKRALQSDARYGRFEDTPINDAKKRVAASLRGANEQAVMDAAAADPANSRLQALAEQFVPAKRTIGNLTEAEQAAREGATRGAHRGTFDLPEKMEMMRAVGEGSPGGVMASIAHALARPFGPSTLASSAYALRRPDVVAELAALLQRANQTGSKGGDFTASTPIRRDEQGRPIITVHLGAQ